MRKLFLLAIILIAPFFALHAESQNMKKTRKAKNPHYPVIGHADGWKGQACQYSFSGTVVVETTHGNDTVGSRGDRDVLILCRNGNGDIATYLHIGGPGRDTVSCLTDIGTDTLLIAGGCSDSALIGNTQFVAVSGMDAFLVRITKKGEMVWLKSWSTSGDDYCSWVWRPGEGIETTILFTAQENEDIKVVSGAVYTAPAAGVYKFKLRFNADGQLISDKDKIFPTF